MFKIKYLCAFVALVAAPLAIAEELSETGEFLDGVAAIVNDGVVLKSQLRDETSLIIRRAEEQDMRLPPANVLQEQVLERLILTEIQLQRADQIGLSVSDQMLNDSIARMAQQAGIPFDQMPAALAADGIDYADFRRGMREEITLEQLRRIMVGQEIDVSDREIEQCITDLEDNVVVNSSWNLSHILINLPDGATAAEIEETRKEAENIYQQIVDGADFGEMAIRYSQSDTSLRGGSLGWIEGQQIPSFFVDVLADMQAGDVSEPFRTSSSYHIVKVNELRSAIQRSEINQTKARHILITPNEIIDDATARQQLENALVRIDEGEDFGELAKLLSDGPTAPVGGDLGWSDPGSFVPEFEQVMNELEIGEISEPFRSPFGWHIVEVLDRRVYDNTEDLKRRNCDARIRNSKMADETQLWMRRLRDEAFVVKRM
ncbi:MAG TPA: peptidylprolyl isomerase [Woeseiaceae bacterium]|nr:peptidylprolyl isomerase [Woeseiaceae bacterium]